MDPLALGPQSGTLTLHTSVEGKAAKMGHKLTIVLNDWSAEATFDGDVPTAVRARAGLASLQVLQGEGGVKPVSDKDKSSIRGNALGTLKAAAHPDVTFLSTGVRATPDGYVLEGDLSIAGATRPATVELSVADAGDHWNVTGGAHVVQSEYGVTPYSTMMGALRVADRVEVRIEAAVRKS